MKKVDFSVVIPVLNEEESLREMHKRVTEVLDSMKKEYEILFIDDGSTDTSFQILKELELKDKKVKMYSFRRNVGKSNALMCGFARANGDFIITLDADLQDDLENIPTLYQKLLGQDLDLISGWRKHRIDTTVKKYGSKTFNKLVSVMFGTQLKDLNSGFKIYRSDLAKEIKIYGGMHRFIPIIAKEMGYSVGELAVNHFPRRFGYSKYKASKIVTDVPDLITIYFLSKYNRRPLHFFGKVGGSIFTFGMLILGYLSILRLFFGESIGTRPLLTLGVLLVITSVQIILTGLLADLIVNFSMKKEEDFPLKYESDTK